MAKPPERFTVLRPAPAPRLKEIPDEEAIDLAKKAYYGARFAQGELMGLYLNHMLFEPGKTVNYSRLIGMRSEARNQVAKAQQVAQLLDDAIEAFKATIPPDSSGRAGR